MDLLLSFAVLIAALLLCLAQDITMLLPLAIGLAAFIIVGRRHGFSLPALLKMSWNGARTSFLLLRVFLFIGCLTGLWRASGTISYCVYYCVQAITPHLFIVICFLLCALMSYALGTSFGVAGTAGVILMAIARAGGVNELLAAGAIISGVYFGDRGSPASSCAHLVATLTHTDITENVRLMLRTAVLPLAVCTLAYGVLSAFAPLSTVDDSLLRLLSSEAELSHWCAVPVVLMLVLPLCRVKVLWAMGSSIVAAFAVSVFVQGVDPVQAGWIALAGYTPAADGLSGLLSGGGAVSMLEIGAVVCLASTYSGIFGGTGLLDGVQRRLGRLADRIGCFPAMLCCAVLSSAVFCNQAIAVMMCDQMLGPVYRARGVSQNELMMDIANSAVPLAGVVPWTIACSVPLHMLGVGAGAIPLFFYLFAVPLCYMLTRSYFTPLLRNEKKRNARQSVPQPQQK